MDHLEASSLLTELVDGSLGPNRLSQVKEHVASCTECHAWIATFRLLGASPGDDLEVSEQCHLSSRDLAVFALSAQNLDVTVRQRCARHVESCPRCLEEVALVRAAISQAQLVQQPPVTWLARRSSFRTSARLALAASVLLLLGALTVAHVLSSTPDDYQLRDGIVGGDRTIEARRLIVVDSTELRSGAALTLRSGELVVFADGFSVHSGASLKVIVETANGS